MGAAIAAELARTTDVPPLALLAVGEGAAAVTVFATRAEAMVVAEGGGPFAAGSNAALLAAVYALRADVHGALHDHVADELEAKPLRTALGTLAPVCTLLANPATPLPEGDLERATTMLKQLLRRELIESNT